MAWAKRTVRIGRLFSGIILFLAGAVASHAAPNITGQPANQVIAVGGTANFSVSANGIGTLAYQWYFQGSNAIPAATGAALSIPNAQSTNSGSYTVVVSDSSGSITSAPASLLVLASPRVVSQPVDVIAPVGGQASFSVTVTGDPPLTFRWYKDVLFEVPGGTNAVLTLTNLVKASAGSYQVVVENPVGVSSSVEAFLLVRQPPFIVEQPVSLVVTQGQSASFAVVAGGEPPFTYQWLLDGIPISGAVNATYLVPSAQGVNAGSYTVRVSNGAATVESVPASLVVRRPPLIVQEPVSLVRTQGGSAVLAVSVEGDAPLAYQWYFNEVIPIPGANAAALVLDPVSPVQEGNYQVTVTNMLGSVTSAVARLTVKFAPAFLTQPISTVTTQGQTVIFSAEVVGSAPLALRWWKDGVPIPGATGAQWIVPNVQAAAAGTYALQASNDVAVVSSEPATLTVRIPPTILVQPADLVLFGGGGGSLRVTAAGDAPLFYQWWFNRTNPVPGATAATLTFAGAGPELAGSYSVSVSNATGVVLSREAIVRLQAPPVIAEQPASLVITQGQPAVLRVVAGGDPPFRYQWFFNETNTLAGSTNASLVFFNTPGSRTGSYRVRVSNAVGAAISEPAQLTVRVPPFVSQNPVSVQVAPGATAVFSVTASGDLPLEYQWYFNQTNLLAGETSSSLVLSNVQAIQAGRYSVTVSNAAGVATSFAAELRVRFPPVITAQPSSLIVTQGGVATFTVGATGDGSLTYRWFQDESNLVATTFVPALTLVNVQPAQVGNYSVQVSNSVGTALSAGAALVVRQIPTIVRQPTGGAVAPGGNFTFDVLVTGEEPFTYQWFFNGATPLVGSNESSLRLTSVSAAAAGAYSVIVSNGVGRAVSANAILAVKRPPVIIAQPQSQTVTQGTAATFSVVVDGDGPFRYQWYRAGGALASATGSVLTLTAPGVQEAGQYTVAVSNEVSGTLSAPADLVVLLKPLILQQPASLVATQGSAVAISVSAFSDTPVAYQWRKNGTLIDGATNSSVNFSAVVPANAGSYDVVLQNNYGAVTSLVAALTVRALDFGDAPDPAFPTLLANDGARHVVVPGFYLGAGIDGELDGQPTPGADGDDDPGRPEDAGVRVLSLLRQGLPGQWEVVVSSNGILNAWVDWDRNGTWNASGEHFIADRAVTAGTNLLTLTTPATAAAGVAHARFRFSSVGGLQPAGLGIDGEVEDFVLTVLPVANLRIGQTTPLARVTAGANVTFTVSITNSGPASAANVRLVAPISPRATFVSAAPARGSCEFLAGVLSCSLGALNSGTNTTVAYTIRAGLGTNDARVTVTADEFDPGLADNAATRTIVGIVSPPAYVNTDSVQLPELDPGPATTYPLDILVSGQTSRIDKVVVTIPFLTHFWPDDLDILLVGPGGQKVLLMSDCGLDNQFVDLHLSFDDDAAASLPNSDPPIVAGTYKPTNFDRLTDNFAAPAPPEPYVTNLSVFKGLSPNGTWSLYVMDDSPENLGYLVDGWTLSLTLADPLADLKLAASSTPATVIAGSPVFISAAVTNRGPAESRTSIRDILPPGYVFVSASASRGGCSFSAGVVTCDFGNLAVGGSATASIEVVPTLGGVFTNAITAVTSQFDSAPGDNTVLLVTTVQPVADVRLARIEGPTSVLLGQRMTNLVVITNAGPNVAGRVTVTNELPSLLVFESAAGGAGACVSSAGAVVCDFGPMESGASGVLAVVLRAAGLGVATNHVTARSAELDFDVANNAIARTVVVSSAADVVTRTLSRRGDVVLNQPFTLEYSVSNSGPSTAVVRLTNSFPASFTLMDAAASQGSCTLAGGGVTCDLGAVAPGQGVLVNVTSRGGALGNWAILAAASPNVADPNPGDNVVTNVVGIIPGADVSVAMSIAPDPVWLGENVSVIARITNAGPMAATAIAFTNRLPAGVQFLNVISTSGPCSQDSGVIGCQIPLIGPGSNAVVSISARGAVPGLGTNRATVATADFDYNLSNNTAEQPLRVTASAGQFASSFSINIPELGAAFPYPATIFVSGLTGAVLRVRVGLTNLTHTYADDLDILVVGPGGQSSYLMSDAGGEFSLVNTSLTFDDTGSVLPDSTSIGSGLVRPVNYDGGDTFAAPAPFAGYATNLTVFTGTDPNGLWSLYVMDDVSKDRGSIGGWSLNFATLDPIADLRLGYAVSSPLLPIGSNLVLTAFATNAGPATATNVRLTNRLEMAFTGVGVSASQGSCTLFGRQLICDLGSIPKDGVVEVVFSGMPTQAELVTNVVTVSGRELDLNPGNNSRSRVIEVALPPVFTAHPRSQIASNGLTVVLEAEVVGSEPFIFQWLRNGLPVPGANQPSLAFPSVSPIQSGLYQLFVSNRVGSALSEVATLQVIGPPTFSDIEPIVTDEDTATRPIPFTVFDFETPGELIQVSAASTNPDIVAGGAIVIDGVGTNRTLRITPVAQAFGSLNIILSAADADGGVTTVIVPMTVRPVNDPPSLGSFENATIEEDATLVVSFLANDVEDSPNTLEYRILSSDLGVVTPDGALFTGVPGSRQLALTPLTNAFGTSVVTVVLTDLEGLSVSNSFILTVIPVNDPPTLDPLQDVIVSEDSGPRTVALTGITPGPANEGQQLQVKAVSGNPAVVPNPIVDYQSPSTSGSLIFAPLPDSAGEAIITVTVTDGGTSNQVFSRTFTVNVVPSGDPPRISAIPNLATTEDTPISVAFTVADPDSSGGLALSATSSDTALIPPGGLVFGGSGMNRTVVISPSPNRFGTASLQIILTDSDGLSATNQFEIVVSPVNDRPTLDFLPDLNLREDAGPTPVNLTGISSGASNETQPLSVTVSSSNPSVIPAPLVTYLSPASTGTLTFTPAPNATGTVVLTVTVDDGQAVLNTFSRSFTVTIAGTNDAPQFSPIGVQTMPEDGTNAVAFTVIDAETAADLLVLSAASSNAGLISATNITFSGSGSNRFVVLAPRPDQSGTATITIRASDGTVTNSTTFTLNVTAVNDPPTLDPLPNLNVTTSPGTVGVVLSGISSGAANESQTLVVSASTSNPGLFLNQPSVNYSSPNATGTLSFRPANNSTGTATISVTVNDGGGGTAAIVRSFVLTVRNSGNTLPTISAIPPQVVNEDATGGVDFTVRDNETAAANLVVTATSTNPGLIPDSYIAFSGSGSNRTVWFTPLPNQTGSASIVLTVTDGAFGSSNLTFGVTVNAINDPPTITGIGPQTIAEDTSTAFIPISISDVETAPQQLVLTASSSNPSLVPNNRIQLGGSGGSRSLRITPLAEQSGTSIITVRVTDGQATNSITFTLDVTSVDDPPVISGIGPVALDEDAVSEPIHFTISDPDTPLSGLALSVSSSNPALVDVAGLTLAGSGTNRTLTIAPATNQFGQALVSVSVFDGVVSNTVAFELTVNPVNDPPTLDAISDQVVAADGISRTLLLSGIGSGAANENQVVAVGVAVDEPGLMLNLQVSHLPGAADAVLTFTPVLGAAGTAHLTVTANDGQATNNPTTRTFAVTLNQPPVFAYLPDVLTDEDVPAGPIALRVTDADGLPSELVVTVTSANPALVAPGAIVLTGSGTDRLLTLTPTANQSGVARLVVTATDGRGTSVTNSFFLIVRSVVDPILITVQPRDIFALAGAAASFSVTAESVLPLSYQWQYEGIDLPSETGPSLTLPAVQDDQAGGYRVIISSADVSVVSRRATLTLVTELPGPTILAIRRSVEGIDVDFDTIFGGVYTLEYKRSLDERDWTPLGATSGNGGVRTLTDTGAGEATRFYRVRAER